MKVTQLIYFGCSDFSFRVRVEFGLGLDLYPHFGEFFMEKADVQRMRREQKSCCEDSFQKSTAPQLYSDVTFKL